MFKLKKLNAIIALEVIISMTLYYFLLIGYVAVTYAIDVVETNNHNVDFSAYFINSNGENVDSLEKFINEEEYLYVDVTVKNEGFFNGTLNLSNNNFNIKQEILGENIEKITENEVVLKQINAGTTETIKLAIEPVKNNEILKSVFYGETNVNLSGKYVNSKNIENGSFDDINGTTKVSLDWKATETISSDLEAIILTNKIYEKEENSKRIVQLLVNSGIKNNEFPIGKNVLSLTVPENVQDVKVFARQTQATNPKLKFGEANYIYDKVNHTLNIQIENNDENTIFWNKDSKDTFIVTYVFDKDYDVSKDNIKVDSNIYTYDNKEIKNSTSISINEEKDGIITNELVLNENSIFKGKLYTGEEREIITNSKIYINNLDFIEKIVINENEAKYLKDEEEIDANILYKTININKQEFLSLFGEEGYITVKDETGVTVGNISKNSNEDENGNIKLNFSIGKKRLKLETSKPILEGTLNIENTKVIQNTETSSEFVNSLTGIKEEIQTSYNDKVENIRTEKTIELKNTSSKAKLEVGVEKLTAIQKNEQVKLNVILENNNESRDLYQNSEIKVRFPKQVTELSNVKCKVLYGNGLKITEAIFLKEGENQVINIKLSGTQNTYNSSIVEGTTIVIYTDLELSQDTENTKEDIILNYTNELATSFEDNGEQRYTLELEEIPQGLRNVSQENIETQNMRATVSNNSVSSNINDLKCDLKSYVGGEELSEGDVVYKGEILKLVLSIENTGNSEINNVNIQANVPEGTAPVRFVEKYKSESEQSEFEYNIFDEYEEIQIDGDTINDSLHSIKGQDKKTLVYEYKIKEETNINEIENIIKILFNDQTKEFSAVHEVQNSEISLRIFGYDMGIESKEGLETTYGYTYGLFVNNLKDADINNVNIKLTSKAFTIESTFEPETAYNSYKDTFSIDNIPAKKSKMYYINVTPNDSEDIATMYAKAQGKYRSNMISKNVKTRKFTFEMSSDTEGKQVELESNIVYKLQLKNTGDIEIGSMQIAQQFPKYLDIKTVIINNKEIEFEKKYSLNNLKEYFSESAEENEDFSDKYYITYFSGAQLKKGEKVDIIVNAVVKNIPQDEETEIYSVASLIEENNKKTNKIKNTILNKPVDIEDDDNETGNSSDEEIIDEKPDDEYYFDNKDVIDESQDNEYINDNTGNNNGENEGNEGNQENPNNETDNDQENNENNQYKLSGLAWLDENENGKRDSEEELLSGIEVELLNLNNNKTTKSQTQNGKYEFSNLEKGKYLVLFNYDTEKYVLTTYQANGVEENINSDVEISNLTIDGNTKKVASTDQLTIDNNNLENIDIGLKKAKKFDLKLAKTIKKVTLSNTEGKKTIDYDDANLAKIEIAAKYLKGTTVAIEYSIKVTNEGEIAGNVKNIVDYKPADLNFNSSINNDWYQSGENLYSKALENTEIKPGETKELKLVLTKTMTETNTGLTNNTAEIAEYQSNNGKNDIDSTPNNKKSGEDDLGSANLIVSVKTGALISYITITLSLSAIIAIGCYVIMKRFINKF